MTHQLFSIRTAALSLGLTTILAFGAAPTYADIVTTDQLAAQSQTASTRSNLTTLLARTEIKAQMNELGVSADDVQGRIDGMTDAEVASLYAQLDALPAGGGALGIVLTLVLIFILLDLAGVTDVFPGV